jgi:hypothetical protein
LSYTSSPFYLVIFQIRLEFMPELPGPRFSYLCFLHSLNDRYTPSHLACWLRWCLTNIFPWLAPNWYPPDLCLWVAGVIGDSHCAQPFDHSFFFFFFFVELGTGVWIQGFLIARQACHLSHISCAFLLWLFGR